MEPSRALTPQFNRSGIGRQCWRPSPTSPVTGFHCQPRQGSSPAGLFKEGPLLCNPRQPHYPPTPSVSILVNVGYPFQSCTHIPSLACVAIALCLRPHWQALLDGRLCPLLVASLAGLLGPAHRLALSIPFDGGIAGWSCLMATLASFALCWLPCQLASLDGHVGQLYR